MTTAPFENIEADLNFEPITGYLHTGQRLNVPLISHVVDNLYVGGHNDLLDLGDFFSDVFSLYVWGAPYRTGPDTRHHSITLYDATDEDLSKVQPFIDQIVYALELGGNVLVHCQAGINRSNLAAVLALREWKGMTSGEAIALLRQRRDKLVLSNSGFERYLRNLDEPVSVQDYPGDGRA